MASSTTSNWLYTKYMNYILRGEAFTPPTTVYIALFNALPALNGSGGTEVPTAGTGYTRQAVLTTNAKWSDPTTGGTSLEISNTEDIVFPVPLANWGTIVGAGIYDASSGGNLLWTSIIGTSRPVSAGDGSPRILVSQCKIQRAVC